MNTSLSACLSTLEKLETRWTGGAEREVRTLTARARQLDVQASRLDALADALEVAESEVNGSDNNTATLLQALAFVERAQPHESSLGPAVAKLRARTEEATQRTIEMLIQAIEMQDFEKSQSLASVLLNAGSKQLESKVELAYETARRKHFVDTTSGTEPKDWLRIARRELAFANSAIPVACVRRCFSRVALASTQSRCLVLGQRDKDIRSRAGTALAIYECLPGLNEVLGGGTEEYEIWVKTHRVLKDEVRREAERVAIVVDSIGERPSLTLVSNFLARTPLQSSSLPQLVGRLNSLEFLARKVNGEELDVINGELGKTKAAIVELCVKTPFSQWSLSRATVIDPTLKSELRIRLAKELERREMPGNVIAGVWVMF